MNKQVTGKIITVVVLLSIIALIVARFWDNLAATFLFIGKAMSGEMSNIGAAGWFAMVLMVLFAGLVIAGVVFFIRLIIITIKAKGDDK